MLSNLKVLNLRLKFKPYYQLGQIPNLCYASKSNWENCRNRYQSNEKIVYLTLSFVQFTLSKLNFGLKNQ